MTRADCIRVQLTDVASKSDLHRVLSHALNFPSWYGNNWDAFWDAITGLVEMPHRLELIGWREFSARLPQEAATLEQILSDLQQESAESGIEIVYA